MTHEQDMGEGPELAGVDVDLSAFAPALHSASVWAVAPSDLGDRVLTVIAHERAATATTDGATLGTDATVTPIAAASGRRRWLLRAVLPAAAAVVLAFGAGVWLGRNDEPAVAVDDPADAAATVSLTGTELAPAASATGLIFDRGAGYSIRLHVDGLAPAPTGEYYEGWLQSPTGDQVSVGTFHMRGGDGTVVLWSGVAVEGYPTLLVTKQVEGEEASSPQVVLSGSVT